MIRSRQPTQIRRKLSTPLGANDRRKPKLIPKLFPCGCIALFIVWIFISARKYGDIIADSPSVGVRKPHKVSSAYAGVKGDLADHLHWRLPPDFDNVLHRAREMSELCVGLESSPAQFKGFDKRELLPNGNSTIASLPAFGIIDDIETWHKNPPRPGSNSTVFGDIGSIDPDKWKCELPHRRECTETQFTVVFMAYNPDRLQKTFKEMKKMLTDEKWKTLVHEVVLVWNGPRDVDENDQGKEMLEFAKTNSLRVTYPLKMGFPNDLMNRYHPDVVNVTTKAILFYDDDGPFYSFEAVQSGFELWKRHSTAQIGAMARQLNYNQRQAAERKSLGEKPNDYLFISHCDNVDDEVEYNFYYFANYDANMVLPSGSFLHSNYLCFLWHPLLERVRKFVRAHPVHPDDMTVSLVVSQIAGRAPRVYSRNLRPDPDMDKKLAELESEQRRLLEAADEAQTDWIAKEEDIEYDFFRFEKDSTTTIPSDAKRHRRLMDGINWDAGAGMTDQKRVWAGLRKEAINSLLRYFGSINSGSIGWCEDTEYYDESEDGRCKPKMAKQGWLPWMNPDGTPKECS